MPVLPVLQFCIFVCSNYMIDIALKYLMSQVNERMKTLPDPDASFILAPINWSGGLPKMAFMLVNIDEEKILKAQLAREKRTDDKVQFANPEIRLNLLLMLAANPDQYEMALTNLSAAITFFQGRAFFDKNSAGFPKEFDQLSIEMYSLSIEQQNQLWASIGAKYIPSVIYKVRLITIADKFPDEAKPLIKAIDNDLKRI